MGRPKGSKNEKNDTLEAFAIRVERQILKASLKGQETMERLLCRLLTNEKAPAIAGMMAAKWVEWRYGKPVQPIKGDLTISYTEALAKMRAKREQSNS